MTEDIKGKRRFLANYFVITSETIHPNSLLHFLFVRCGHRMSPAAYLSQEYNQAASDILIPTANNVHIWKSEHTSLSLHK